MASVGPPRSMRHVPVDAQMIGELRIGDQQVAHTIDLQPMLCKLAAVITLLTAISVGRQSHA